MVLRLVIASVISAIVASTAVAQQSFWRHNNSIVYLEAKDNSRSFYYWQPRDGMARVGVRRNTLLFNGYAVGLQYSGTAYIFSPKCEPSPYDVLGPILNDFRKVVMYGKAPLVDSNCHIYGYKDDTLLFEIN